MKKEETPEEIAKRINEKFRKAPKGMGELIGRYEPINKPTPKKNEEKK
jgi:hypothetical protein